MAVLTVAACFVGGAPRGFTQKTEDLPGTARPSNYRLTPGDTVQIEVLGEAELDRRVQISRDGSIEFPFIGKVRLEGKTAEEGAKLLAAELDREYLVRPQVTLSVSAHAERKFTIMGQVERTGSFAIPPGEDMDLLKAIAAAGGFSRIADHAKVTIRRVVNGREQIIPVDARPLMKRSAAPSIAIIPNDVITVGERLF